MNNLAAFDETADINLTSNYSLSICLLADGFSFCILDEVRNKYIGIKHFDFGNAEINIKEVISELFITEDYLTKTYRKVRVMIQQSRSTLIPLPLFDQQNIEQIAGFNFEIHPLESILFNKINKINSYCLFPFDNQLKELIDARFTNAVYFHQSQPVIENALQSGTGNNPDRIHLFINSKSIDICLIKSSGFSLFNSYQYTSQQDILYYSLNLLEQFKISPEKSDLLLSGSINKHDDLWSAFSRYIKNIKLELPSDIQSRSYRFNDLQIHNFTHLLNLPQCG